MIACARLYRQAGQAHAFMSQRGVQDVVFRARRAKIAVLSVGFFLQRQPDRQLRLHQADGDGGIAGGLRRREGIYFENEPAGRY